MKAIITDSAGVEREYLVEVETQFAGLGGPVVSGTLSIQPQVSFTANVDSRDSWRGSSRTSGGAQW